MGGPPVGIERIDDRGDVAHGGCRRVGIAAVRDHLHIAGKSEEESPLEILIDLNSQDRLPLIDRDLQVGGPVEVRDAAKDAGSVQPGQQIV